MEKLPTHVDCLYILIPLFVNYCMKWLCLHDGLSAVIIVTILADRTVTLYH